MKEIDSKKLTEIKGGGISIWGCIGIGALTTFLIGVIDGFVRPIKCN